MTIRQATPDDEPRIADIWNHAIRETTITFNPVEKTTDEVIALTAQDCLVWEEQGQVIGFARYFPFRGGEVKHLIHPVDSLSSNCRVA